MPISFYSFLYWYLVSNILKPSYVKAIDKRMKILLTIPFIVFSISCQQITPPTVKTLPPVVETSPTQNPKAKKHSPSKIKESKPLAIEAPELKSTVNPLTPDPSVVTPTTTIPRFEVPENVQPKVSDGINQGEFIELKW